MALDGSRGKLRRALHHFTTLDGAINQFLTDHRFDVTTIRPFDEPLWFVVLKDPPMPPVVDWALIIGDCVHNLRSALDYVAWELAGSNPGDTQTQFPIFDTREGWDSRRERRIGRWPAEARALVEQLQPFQSADPPTTALSGLRRLSDADKHKLLTITTAMHHHISFEFSHPGGNPATDNWIPVGEMVVYPRQALLHNEVVGAITVAEPPQGVTMTASISPFIAFTEAVGLGEQFHVLGCLESMIVEVRSVVSSFAERFFSETPSGQ